MIPNINTGYCIVFRCNRIDCSPELVKYLIAQSVERLATGWTTRGSGSSGSGRVKKFSLPHIVQTGSGVHPTSYKMGTGGLFPGGKAAGA
jgi:hypothetical protein